MEPLVPLFIVDKKKRNSISCYEIWAGDEWLEWLREQKGVAIVRTTSTPCRLLLMLDPRYSETDFERLVEFINLPTGMEL